MLAEKRLRRWEPTGTRRTACPDRAGLKKVRQHVLGRRYANQSNRHPAAVRGRRHNREIMGLNGELNAVAPRKTLARSLSGGLLVLLWSVDGLAARIGRTAQPRIRLRQRQTYIVAADAQKPAASTGWRNSIEAEDDQQQPSTGMGTASRHSDEESVPDDAANDYTKLNAIYSGLTPVIIGLFRSRLCY